MQGSRTRNAILIMLTSGIRQVLTLSLTFVSRTVFIHILGAEYLGVSGLFANILSLLALSELGIGTAISFYLYKPLVDKDVERIRSLMRFYKMCYRIVGLAIMGIGCCLIPLLPFLVKFEQNVSINLYLVYLLYLSNTASSYLFFAYKQALVIADQRQYEIETINIAFVLINCLVDIILLAISHDYIIYLVGRLLSSLTKNIVIARKIDRKYPYLREKDVVPVSRQEIAVFFKDIRDVSLFRIGSALFNMTDNIIISVLLGTVVVGYYSNYFLVLSQISVVIGMIIRSVSAGIGNVVAKEDREKQYHIFRQLDFGVYCIVVVCTSCLCQLLDSFMKLWVGGISQDYILGQVTVVLLCISFYLDGTTQIMNAFREASGCFATGKVLQLVGGVANIFLSVVLGKVLGLPGIFAATVISKGCITVVPFMIGVSQDVFGKRWSTIIRDHMTKGLVMLIDIALLWMFCRPIHMKKAVDFLAECVMAMVIPTAVLLAAFWRRPEMKALICRIMSVYRKVRGIE